MSEPTFNGDLSPDEDLPRTWQHVVHKLEERAHFKLASEAPPSIESIAVSINPPKMAPTKVQQARDTVVLTLKCLHGIAGMVSQVATVVFGPSEQIMNAVSFVVQVCQNVQDVFDNLTALMDRLSIFLSRLADYYHRKGYIDRGDSPKLEPAVRRGVYKVLENFVTIMALSYELGREWAGQESRGFKAKAQNFGKKVRVVLKVGAFGSDMGVKAAIAQFERSVLDVSDLQIDDIHRRMNDTALAVVDISVDLHKVLMQGDKNAVITERLLLAAERQAADTDHIVVGLDHNTTMTKQILNLAERSTATAEQSRKREDAKTQLEQLRKALNIAEEDFELHTRCHQEYADCLPTTGTWLFERDAFKIWSRLRGLVFREGRLLSIQAPNGHGKSYLSHAVIEHLKAIGDEQSVLQIHTAWHYFTPHEGRKHSILQAIRQIILQLAQLDSSYMSFIRDLTAFTLADNAALVKNLLGAYADRSRSATTWYIILDGLDHAEPDDSNILNELVTIVRRSSTATEGIRVRLFLTGNQAAIEHARFLTGGVGEVFDLGFLAKLPQEDDLIRFADFHLSQSPMFQHRESTDKHDLRSEVETKLLEITHGDYNKLKRRLQDIIGADDIASVREILRLAQDDDLFSMRSQIEDLNKGKHIHALNILLAWINVASRELSAPVLKDIVQLTCGDESIAEPTDYLDKRCNKLVTIYIEQDCAYAKFKPEAQSALAAAEPRLLTVTPAEINLVEKMLQRQFSTVFGDLDLYENFAFNSFFQQKRAESKQDELVHLPPQPQCSIMVADHCLRVLCDILDETRYISLRSYAKMTIWTNVFAIRPGMVDDPTQRAAFGSKIYRLLSEPTLIGLWVEYVDMHDVLQAHEDTLQNIRDWLIDPAVIKGIRNQSTRALWLPEEHSSRSHSADVLEQVARCALKKWFENPDADEVKLSLQWLNQHFRVTGPYQKEYEETLDEELMTTNDIDKWLSWARVELTSHGVVMTEHRWLYAMAFAYNNIIDFMHVVSFEESERAQVKAIELCGRVLSTAPNFWRATVLKASILSSRGLSRPALDMLVRLRTTHSALVGVDGDFTDWYWKAMMPLIARTSIIENDLNEAVTSLAAVIEHEMSEPAAKSLQDALTYLPAQFLAALYKLGEHNAAFDFLARCHSRHNTTGENWLGRLIRIGEDDLHHQLLVSAFWANAYDQIDSYYLLALEEHRQVVDTSLSAFWPDKIESKRLWLRWRCREHTEVIEGYESLIEKHAGKDSPVLSGAVQRLTQVLLQLLNRSDISNKEHDRYMRSLTTLSQYFQHGGYDDLDISLDPTLALARVYHRQKRTEFVRITLFRSLSAAVKDIREAQGYGQTMHWERLAMTLPLLDCDDDALAAWAMWLPDQFWDEGNDAASSTDDAAPTDTSEAVPNVVTTSNSTTAAEEAVGETHALQQGQIVATADQHEGVPEYNESGSPFFKGKLYISCSGCDELLNCSGSIAYCKDCLGIFLCESCHRALKKHRLPRQICDAKHSFFVVPAYDDKTWRAAGKDAVQVGDRIIAIDMWLDELVARWQLDASGKTARGIDKFKMIWRSKRSMRRGMGLADVVSATVNRTESKTTALQLRPSTDD